MRSTFRAPRLTKPIVLTPFVPSSSSSGNDRNLQSNSSIYVPRALSKAVPQLVNSEHHDQINKIATLSVSSKTVDSTQSISTQSISTQPKLTTAASISAPAAEHYTSIATQIPTSTPIVRCAVSDTLRIVASASSSTVLHRKFTHLYYIYLEICEILTFCLNVSLMLPIRCFSYIGIYLCISYFLMSMPAWTYCV